MRSIDPRRALGTVTYLGDIIEPAVPPRPGGAPACAARKATTVTATLLDTHALIWWVNDPKRLSRAAPRRAQAENAAPCGVSENLLREVRPWSARSNSTRFRKSMNGGPAAAEPVTRRCGNFAGDRKELVTLTMTRAWESCRSDHRWQRPRTGCQADHGPTTASWMLGLVETIS